jgi:Flp pilus assembly protein TadG
LFVIKRKSCLRRTSYLKRLSYLLRRFARHDRASASVEFAFVATPFVGLTLGILQTALIFLSGQSLEAAAAVAGRLVMTGQAQTQGWTAAQFKTQVCNQIHAIFNCTSGIYVDVEAYSSFASVNLAMPINNGVFNTSAMAYNPGVPGQVVVVRVYYQYPVFFSPLKLSNLNSNADLLAATAVFQNEPYTPL